MCKRGILDQTCSRTGQQVPGYENFTIHVNVSLWCVLTAAEDSYCVCVPATVTLLETRTDFYQNRFFDQILKFCAFLISVVLQQVSKLIQETTRKAKRKRERDRKKNYDRLILPVFVAWLFNHNQQNLWISDFYTTPDQFIPQTLICREREVTSVLKGSLVRTSVA